MWAILNVNKPKFEMQKKNDDVHIESSARGILSIDFNLQKALIRPFFLQKRRKSKNYNDIRHFQKF